MKSFDFIRYILLSPFFFETASNIATVKCVNLPNSYSISIRCTKDGERVFFTTSVFPRILGLVVASLASNVTTA